VAIPNDFVGICTQTGRNDGPAAVGAAACGISSGCGAQLASSLRCSVQGQIEFGQTRRGELDRLPALQDRFDQLRAQEGVTNEPSDAAPGDAFVPPPILEGHSLGRALGRTCSDVRSMSPILWQVGYIINDNVSVWVNEA
jgi:hypothetical protein